MKKSFVLLISLLVLAVGVVCYGQTSLLSERDQIEFTENVIYGDKSIVDGVTVEMENHYEEQLFWNSTYVIGETPQIHTDYKFYHSKQNENDYSYRGSMYFNADYYNRLEWIDWNENSEDVPKEGMALLMKELAEETQSGEEREKLFFLKDYMDYYAFSVDLSSAYASAEDEHRLNINLNEYELQSYLASGEKNNYPKEAIEQTKEELEWLNAFHEFFKIPVMDTEAAVLSLRKDETGTVTGWGMATAGMGTGTGEAAIPTLPEGKEYDSFYFSTESVVNNKECYFTFYPRTENGELVDTSLIPGGYGIYYLPFDVQEQEIYPEKLAMVYALDPTIQVYNLSLDERNGKLLLFTIEEGLVYLSVIDIETMTLVEKFEIGTEESGIGFHKIYDDYMVVDANAIVVFEIDADGNYKKVLSAPREKLDIYEVDREGATYMPNWDTEFDWNGETLIFANYIFNEVYYPEPSFYVAAMDETGLVYLASYQSSLCSTHSYEIDGEYAYQYSHVRPDREQVKVRWK